MSIPLLENKIWLRRTQQKVGRLSAGSKITSLLTGNDIFFCGTEAGVIKVNNTHKQWHNSFQMVNLIEPILTSDDKKTGMGSVIAQKTRIRGRHYISNNQFKVMSE